MRERPSRRSLLAGLGGSAMAVGTGCVERLPLLGSASGPITVLAIGASNGLDRPIGLSLVLRVSGETVRWRSIELEPSGHHVIAGPWEADPGDLTAFARYRPLDDPADVPGDQTADYSLSRKYGDCMAISASVEAYRGIVVWGIDPPDDVGPDCEVPEEWGR